MAKKNSLLPSLFNDEDLDKKPVQKHSSLIKGTKKGVNINSSNIVKFETGSALNDAYLKYGCFPKSERNNRIK